MKVVHLVVKWKQKKWKAETENKKKAIKWSSNTLIIIVRNLPLLR